MVAIERAVGTCGALLAIIGPEWMRGAESGGRSRLDDSNDFVRIEIAIALNRGIPVLPVLVDEARLPAPDDLPDDLKPLVRRNAVVLRDSRWDADFEDLARSVERLLRSDARAQEGVVGRLRSISAGANTSWLRGAVAGLGVIGVGFAAVRGCTLDTASNTPPAIVLPAAPAPGPATSAVREQLDGARSGGTATRQAPVAPARRAGLGIAWFGVWLDTVTKDPPGVVVGEVAPGGPAARAGIQVDDVLIDVAGRPVTTFMHVQNAVVDHVRNELPDTPATVRVVRAGTQLDLPIVFDRQFVLTR